MSKILQIKRGTAAETKNYTGRAGEITMDTDAQTIRLHDGATAGGVAIARADLSNVDFSTLFPAAENFDINSVSPEFWANLFEQNNIRPKNFIKTDGWPLLGFNRDLTLLTGFPGTWTSIDMNQFATDSILVCNNAEAGYDANDVAHEFGLGAGPMPKHVVSRNKSGGLDIVARAPLDEFWVFHKSTGAKININKANWQLIFRAWF
ncbi:MAG: hypothetical protein FWC61_04620 [Proteobacteria bacterium]|nr:hypothetical protein [Pseudomonadota bacterium]